MTSPERRILPDVRKSITHKTVIQDRAMGNISLFITAGMYDDEALGEVWINIGKQGTTLRGLTDTIAIELSLLLQYGVPLEAIVEQFRGHRYEPLGTTANPHIPNCVSIIDYVVQWLEWAFITERQKEDPDA